MGSNSDMRLQLIIEAINRSEAVLGKFKKDLLDVGAGTTAVNSAGAITGKTFEDAGTKGAAGMNKLGPAVAAARDHVAGAQKEMPGLLQKFAALQAQYNAINGTGAATGKTLEETGKKGAAAMDKIHDHGQRAHSMLGQMVQMALVMGTIMFAQKLTDMGIEYNKALEISKLGLGAIMTSMGVITDQQDHVLQGQEKWVASQSLSVEAQSELQAIGMLTAATYVELVEVYQGILAPALSAKMTFEETLDITGLLTNSVKTLGLNINQVKQEARDLIQGGISPASSSLAVALGISDSMVKKWREQGTVYQELKSRLEGFTYAEKEFSSTWDGAWSNFQDVAQRALGEGSKPLFDFIRKEVIKLTGDMSNITRDASGKVIDIQIKPEVVARIRELAEDLKVLIRFLEATVHWAGKLAEPALMIGIAVGINKITTAVKGLAAAANAGALARLITSLPALAAVAGLWAGKQYADAKGLGEEASDVRLRAKIDKDHEGARLRASGVNPLQNINDFGWREMAGVKQRLPEADNGQIAAMLRSGIISLIRESVPGFDKESRTTLQIDDARAKTFLGGDKSNYKLQGPDTKSEEELKKARDLERAAVEDSYKGQIETIKRGETEKVEAIKTALKEKELLYKQGGITELDLMQAQAAAQKNTLQASLDSTKAEQKKLDEEWEAKKGLFEPAERSRAHAAYISAKGKLEDDQLKKTGEIKRASSDEEIKQLDHVRAVEAANRDGALRSVQEQIAAEKHLTQLLLEREKITPLEAEKRDLATDQSSLEAEYWDVTAKKMVKGLGDAAMIELTSQLQVLEQRMESLSQQAPNRLYKAGQDTSALVAKREEARISHELAALDEKEATRQIAKPEVLRQRQGLLKELLASQQAVQAGIDPNDTTAWNTQQAAIDATRQSLLGIKLEMRDLSNDMAGGLAEGFASYVDQVGGSFKQMEGLALETASAMESSFSDFFFDAMQGKMESFGDYVSAFLDSVSRAIANVMAQKAVAGIMGADYGTMFASLISGARAEGGGVNANEAYIVGEKGWEIFVPTSSGTIVSHDKASKSGRKALAGAGGGDTNVYLGDINIPSGGDSGEVDQARAAAFGSMLKATITQLIIDQKRPGGLLS